MQLLLIINNLDQKCMMFYFYSQSTEIYFLKHWYLFSEINKRVLCYYALLVKWDWILHSLKGNDFGDVNKYVFSTENEIQ